MAFLDLNVFGVFLIAIPYFLSLIARNILRTIEILFKGRKKNEILVFLNYRDFKISVIPSDVAKNLYYIQVIPKRPEKIRISRPPLPIEFH